jgi:hypothetical protein
MPHRNYNWLAGCLVLVITLAVLFGGQLLWNKYAVANPINEMFKNIDGVESATVGRLTDQGKNNEKFKIYVRLSNVPDLQKAYGEITDGLNQIDSGKKYDIVIEDKRTPDLERFYYDIHYYIQEAISTGNFATMAERIEAKAETAGITAKVYVDTQNVYLQMTKSGAEMYVIIARNDSALGGKSHAVY